MTAMIPEKYQTFWPRFWAACFDALVFVPIGIADHFFWKWEAPIPIRTAWILIHSFSYVAYSVLGHGLYGQTLGKRLLGVRVLDASGEPLRMWQALLRDSGSIGLIVWQTAADFPFIIHGIRPVLTLGQGFRISDWIAFAWCVLELVTMLTNSRRRALHDLIARSIVVRTGRSIPGESPSTGAPSSPPAESNRAHG
jgi:uncharacterized RDD family membrane protein YckC